MEFLAPFHPQVVHFPVALLTLYPLIIGVFAVTGKEFYNKAALLFLALGVLSSIFALLTGNAAATVNNIKNSSPLAYLDNHIFYANATVWFFSLLLIAHFRYYVMYTIKKKTGSALRTTPYLLLVAALVGLFFVRQTGSYGGSLVYKFGIGVKPAVTDSVITK